MQSKKNKGCPGMAKKIPEAKMNFHMVWEFLVHTGKNPLS